MNTQIKEEGVLTISGNQEFTVVMNTKGYELIAATNAEVLMASMLISLEAMQAAKRGYEELGKKEEVRNLTKVVYHMSKHISELYQVMYSAALKKAKEPAVELPSE